MRPPAALGVPITKMRHMHETYLDKARLGTGGSASTGELGVLACMHDGLRTSSDGGNGEGNDGGAHIGQCRANGQMKK